VGRKAVIHQIDKFGGRSGGIKAVFDDQDTFIRVAAINGIGAVFHESSGIVGNLSTRLW
jgi:hypothetical protein